MPMLIQFIDAIARQKQRDVLFVCFEQSDSNEDGFWIDSDDIPERKDLIDWLKLEGIGWSPCGGIADENCMVSYMGQIYLDVPFDLADPQYQKVAAKLENPDGSPRNPRVKFFYLPLSRAMKNAHHDEPGFWERWAEKF